MFKIGDKVKPKDPKWKHGAGTIIRLGKRDIWVHYDTDACVLCSGAFCNYPVQNKTHRLNDVRRVVQNKQLEFDFMEQE